MRRAATALRAPAASSNSRLLVGTSVTRETRPGAWPLRPARCSRRATPLALPICSTRSTGKKSTPRSRLAVQMTALRMPLFRPSSTHSRTSRSSEPWCSAMTPAQSGRASRMFWYQISDCERVLVNTSVASCFSISSITGCSICRPRWPPQGKRETFSGIRESTTIFLRVSPSTSTPASSPSSTWRARSRLPIVADTPQTRSSGRQRRSRASASCTCTPRLLPISSCHSSTMIMSRLRNCSSAAALLIMSVRLSGVVTRVAGMLRVWRARSLAFVSPVRAPMRHSGISSAAESSSARCVSAASARIGVIHRTRKPALLRPDASPARCSAANQTAKVLPAPVFACSRPDSPLSAAFQTLRWNGNTVQPRPANHASTRSLTSLRLMRWPPPANP